MAGVSDALKAELGGEVPPGLEVLDAAVQKRLVQTLRAAKQRQQKHLDEAIDEALKHVPALLRSPIRRLFD